MSRVMNSSDRLVGSVIFRFVPTRRSTYGQQRDQGGAPNIGSIRRLCRPRRTVLPCPRQAVVDDRQGGALVAILRKLARAGFGVGSHDVLQRVPRGLDPDHPRADLLKRKGLIVTFPEPPRELLVTRTFVDWLVTHTKRAVPLVEWLASLAE